MDRRNFIQTSAALPLTMAAVSASTVKAEEKESIQNPVDLLTKNLLPTIEHRRQVALDILKPSAKQLEHGLRLHAESIVFDAYGFSPRSSEDGTAIAEAMKAGASALEIKDMREDSTMTRCVTDAVEQREYKEAWRASGVTSVFQNAGEEGQDPLILMKRLAHFTYVTDMLRDFVSKAVTPDDIVDAKKENRHCLYFTGNGMPITQQWVSVEDELRYVKIFYELGIRMMHLTYQRRNMIGDGCGEKANGGLSDFGKRAILEMNRIGIIPDCAHSGWQTSLEAAQVSTKPVVASHSIAGGIYSHIRSKPDNVIKAIADSGGYIGICCIPRYLRGKGDITALLDHIDYVVKKFGIDYVAIGADVGHNSSTAGTERKKHPRGERQRTAFRMLWPSDDFKTTPQMTSSICWTNWPLFTVGLVQRGYSDADIQKIIGGNVMRVIRDAMK